MSDDDKVKSFWTTLPGILTGLSTLITAIVGLLSVLTNNKAPAKPPGAGSKPPEAVASVTAGNSTKPVNDAACNAIVGNWLWNTGSVQFSTEGYVGWKVNYTDQRPAYTGTWTCVDPAARRFAITWPNGFIDTLTLSPDGNSLSGANQVGYPTKGTRVK